MPEPPIPVNNNNNRVWNMVLILLAETDPTGWTGPAALTAAGLLAMVLAWIFTKHLPAKDEQLKGLLMMQIQERETERSSRSKQSELFAAIIERLHEQHKKDAEADRQAFETRNGKVEAAIMHQTTELKLELQKQMNSVCKFIGCDNYVPKHPKPHNDAA